MTTINVNTVAPAGSVLTVGDSGDTIVAVDEIKVNTVKDAGGNTLWVSNGSGTLSSVSSGFGGALNLLSTQTASNSANVAFTSGIDSTYKEYVFEFININPATDAVTFHFNGSDDASSWSYDVVKTTTVFDAYHYENDGGGTLEYASAQDLAQSTAYQTLVSTLGNDADQCASGKLHLFNPSSTTYVKNFYGTFSYVAESSGSYEQNNYVAGYFNTTSAITAIDFKMSSGNINAGTIKMYGVS